VTPPLAEITDDWAGRLGWSGGGKQLLDEIESRIEVQNGSAIARYSDLRLESVFQPVLSLAHGRAVGFEALVRAFPRQERHSVPPADVFMRAAERGESVLVDGLCRALHLVNFAALPTGDDRYLIDEPRPLVYLDAERDLVDHPQARSVRGS